MFKIGYHVITNQIAFRASLILLFINLASNYFHQMLRDSCDKQRPY